MGKAVPPQVSASTSISALESSMSSLWSGLLHNRRLDADDNFFEQGGDSVLAIALLLKIEETFAVKLPFTALIDAPTIRSLSAMVAQHAGPNDAPTLVQLRAGSNKLAPIFCVPGATGHVMALRDLAMAMQGDQAVFGFEAPYEDDDDLSIQQIAREYLRLLRQQQPKGPYYLIGLCFGALVTYEMACRLEQSSEQVDVLAMLDPLAPGSFNSPELVAQVIGKHIGNFFKKGPKALFATLAGLSQQKHRSKGHNQSRVNIDTRLQRRLDFLEESRTQRSRAGERYKPKSYSGALQLFVPADDSLFSKLRNIRGWTKLTGGNKNPNLRVIEVNSDHGNFFRAPHCEAIIDVLAPALPTLPGKKSPAPDPASTELRVSLLGSSTTQLLNSALEAELGHWQLNADIVEAGFNQYRQTILDPGSPLYQQQAQVLVLQLDAEDLFAELLNNPLAFTPEMRRQRVSESISELCALLDKINQRLPETLLIINTLYLSPRSLLTGLEYHSAHGCADIPLHYNLLLSQVAQERPQVLVHDVASLMANLGYQNSFDPRLWFHARTRMSSQATLAMASNLARLIRGALGQTRKCLVLDLDNTLWGGLAGEDGLTGIVLGDSGEGLAFAEFQSALLTLNKKGVLLALCSKNNEADALTVLTQHPDMRLGLENFAAMRINWQDKASNLRSLAEELNIGLDSFVFIDDNPAEQELIRATLPQVYVPHWPRSPYDYLQALQQVTADYFAKPSLTTEDTQRTTQYLAASKRREHASTNPDDLAGYLTSLNMHAVIAYANSYSIPRIAQLTQKTNQFNLTTKRYTEAEIQALTQLDSVMVLSLRLQDRYGDEGIVGVLIMREQAATNSWHIDTLLLSCRVIGREAETSFLAAAITELKKHKAALLTAEYIPTAKNALCAGVYEKLGFTRSNPADRASSHWQLLLGSQSIQAPAFIKIEAPTPPSV